MMMMMVIHLERQTPYLRATLDKQPLAESSVSELQTLTVYLPPRPQHEYAACVGFWRKLLSWSITLRNSKIS
jgi:hypothetical protein